MNNQTGETFISQETIARITGHNIRTVQRAIDELERRGFLIVKRHDLGAKRNDGRRAYGGRGIANIYRIAIDRTCAMGTNRGRVLVRRAEQIQTATKRPNPRPGEQGETAAASNDSKRRQGHRPFDKRSTALRPEKIGAEAVPTLTDPTDQNSSGGNAVVEPVRAFGLLEEVKRLLRDRSRDKNLDLWIRDISDWRIEGETITLFVPSRFHEDQIRTRYGNEILLCWHRLLPEVDRLKFVSRR